MGLTRLEQEIVYRYDADGKTVTLQDYRDSTHKAMTAAGYEPSTVAMMDGEVVGWVWRGIPIGSIAIMRGGKVRVGKSNRKGGGSRPAQNVTGRHTDGAEEALA